MLFPHLPEQRRPTLEAHKPPDDFVRCHKCGRKAQRVNAYPEEKQLKLVYVCRRCCGE